MIDAMFSTGVTLEGRGLCFGEYVGEKYHIP
jgi:hypothetical protein